MSSLREVAAAGDRLETLYALRDVLARQIEMTESGRDVAALSLRFMSTLAEIDTLERESAPDREGTGLDELNARRAAREAGAARSA
jgi:hypothetical protein